MSVQSSVDRLQSQLDRYNADIASIYADKRFSPEYRDRQVAALNDSAKAAAIAAATELWGAIEIKETPDGTYQLSDNGVVWRELKADGERIARAREQAE